MGVLLKIAIFQDYFENIGGAEKLVLSLAKQLNATIITTNLNKSALKHMEIENIKIINLGMLPKHVFLKHWAVSLKFFLCDFSKDFDFFIFSGNRSIFASKKHKPNLWYCHTPERAVYDLYSFYRNQMNFFDKIIFTFGALTFRFLTNQSIREVQKIVCNSENVKKRIQKYLRQKAKIIFPFADTKKFYFSKPGGYWLSVNRLYPSKRVELQIETFRKMPEQKLIIVGDFVKGDPSEEYAKKIFSNAPKNIEFTWMVKEHELARLYANSIGFITTSRDEDFGMTVIEAMASGKPVVAVNEGGYLETVLHKKTGLLVNANIEELISAVKKISKNPKKYKLACIKQAKKFDISKFVKKIKMEMS